MLDRSINPQYLCFPQIDSETMGEEIFTIAALKKVLQLSDIDANLDFIKSRPLTWIDLDKLLKFLNDRGSERPICVMSTLSEKDAISYSYQELGLNLFDLPWFSKPEEKVFRYVNLLELFNNLEDLHDCFSSTAATIANEKFKDAAQHLQWAKCHQFAKDLQTAVVHGERDRMQDISMTLDRMKKSITGVKKNYSDLPCQNCQLSQKIDDLLNQPNIDKDGRLKFAQEVAALDCQRYRLAESLYTPASNELEPPKFKKIAILDDDVEFRELLKKKFKDLKETELVDDTLVDSDNLVEILDEKLCWRNFGLFTEGDDKENPGKRKIHEVIDKLIEDNPGLKESEILTCFDLDLGSPLRSDSDNSSHVDDFIKTCFGGHWVLYGAARRNPRVPRLVITGFRSQELISYTAGGSAYLLKPVTTENLVAKIKEASILRRVTWLCFQEIQNEYRNSIQSAPDRSVPGRSLDFDTIHRHLEHWLKWKRIELEIINDTHSNRGRICESEVIVIDLLTLVNKPETHLEESISTITEVRQLNPQASIIFILPLTEGVNDPFANYYRQLPLNLRDGSDLIIRKPMWIAEHPQHQLALGSAIVHQLKRLEDYDTKYQVLIPIRSLLENLPEEFNPNLVDSMKALSEANPPQHPSAPSSNLLKVVKAHGDASQIISDKIIKPLTQVFGGVSSYELGIRGSWYDADSKKVDDTIIVVEFCAKSSLMAKEFIEKTVIRYLKEVAGEDMVLLQEIPIRGRLL
jgi:hypothetical protein